MKTNYTIALVGNPNCGKTTLFNALTGSRQRVGNWPGVTVEKKSGEYLRDGLHFEVVDLPGTYSLDVVDKEVSLDETVARNYVHGNEADLIINIVDAAILERNLYLSSQLAEMRVPLLVALNMVDVAETKGIKVDAQGLARHWAVRWFRLSLRKAQALMPSKPPSPRQRRDPHAASAEVRYEDALERAISALAPQLAEACPTKQNFLSMAGRASAGGGRPGAPYCRRQTEPGSGHPDAELGDDLDIMMADARYSLVNRIANEVVSVRGRINRDLTNRIDRVVLNRALGIPIFLLMMYLMFMFTINIGGAFIDFFDQFAGILLVDGFGEWLTRIGSPEWLTMLLAKGIGGGFQVVATFIPIIGFLFLFLSVLEDSGYMARAAFVMDRFMRWIGLPGKSFIPLIVGFGCNVPAIMATRTLEHRRDRLLTIAMAPFMSCGARLPVYVLFAAAFFADGAQNVVFGLYLIGIVVAVLTGLILKNTLLEGEATPFIMELPPYHVPTLKGILIHTWDRLKGFIFRAGRVIVPMVLVLNVLNSVGTDGSYGNENSNNSVLAAVGRTIAPAFSPMGLTEENWPAAVGIFTGVLAKEAVVGTLNAAYSALATSEAATAKKHHSTCAKGCGPPLPPFPPTLPMRSAPGPIHSVWTWATSATRRQWLRNRRFPPAPSARWRAASTVPPAPLPICCLSCSTSPAPQRSPRFTRSRARSWTIFVAAWTTGLGYGLATLYYQAATWANHPGSSLAWISVVVAGFALVLYSLRRLGRREATRLAQLPQ